MRPPESDEPAAGDGGRGPAARPSFEQIWALLSATTREWLIEHNGEHLPAPVAQELLEAAGGRPASEWWSGGDDEDDTQLTDAAVDWIDETTNAEH